MKRNETTREQRRGNSERRTERGSGRSKRAWTQPRIETSEAFEDVALTTCNQIPDLCVQALS